MSNLLRVFSSRLSHALDFRLQAGVWEVPSLTDWKQCLRVSKVKFYIYRLAAIIKLVFEKRGKKKDSLESTALSTARTCMSFNFSRLSTEESEM